MEMKNFNRLRVSAQLPITSIAKQEVKMDKEKLEKEKPKEKKGDAVKVF